MNKKIKYISIVLGFVLLVAASSTFAATSDSLLITTLQKQLEDRALKIGRILTYIDQPNQGNQSPQATQSIAPQLPQLEIINPNTNGSVIANSGQLIIISAKNNTTNLLASLATNCAVIAGGGGGINFIAPVNTPMGVAMVFSVLSRYEHLVTKVFSTASFSTCFDSISQEVSQRDRGAEIIKDPTIPNPAYIMIAADTKKITIFKQNTHTPLTVEKVVIHR